MGQNEVVPSGFRIEPLRQDKRIGSSLQARVVISAPRTDLSFYERYARELPMLFIVSEVETTERVTGEGLEISIDRAPGVKCERCWRYVPKVSTDPARPGICERCEDALAETVRS